MTRRDRKEKASESSAPPPGDAPVVKARAPAIPPEPAEWGVYVVRCRDGSLYTGCTNRLRRRLADHDAGKGAAYTRGRGPVTLMYWEPVEGRGEALRREAALKRLSRADKLAVLDASPLRRSSGDG